MDVKNDFLLTLGLKNISAAYPAGQTIVDLFEKQAAETPYNKAVIFESSVLTYAELNEKSNQFGHYLRKKGVTEQSLVPLISGRSADLVICMLAVLKAGGAYVPAEPDLPEERIRFILEDCNATIVISNSTDCVKIQGIKHKLILTDLDWPEISKEPVIKVNNRLLPKNLAYVIYTSGSTGLPKGVLVEHENIVRLFKADTELFDFSEKDVWAMFHSPSFDFSVWEMYGALLFGGSVVIVPKKTAGDTAAFCQLLVRHNVTVLNQTPSSFYVLQDYFVQHVHQTTIRYVIFGGEALMPGRIKKWFCKYGNCRLINMYGITETTVHVTFLQLTEAHIISGQSNIGYPIPTLGILILDTFMNPVPIGVPGEMYVAGSGVARGYLNRDTLTRERFLLNPVIDGQVVPYRIYKTGDLAKWHPEGGITYLGRIDSQVKIRGYRIELGEVEAKLQEYPYIQRAVVLAKQGTDGNNFLIGFVIVKDTFDKHAIQSYLAEKLPAYMIPSQWVNVTDIPLTVNGKTNKSELLNLFDEQLRNTAATTFTDAAEKTIAGIWKHILAVEPADSTVSFFEMGGHSLLLLELSTQISLKFDCSIPVTVFFEYTTIKEQAAYISTLAAKGSLPVYESSTTPAPEAVTSTQKALFIRNKLNPADAFPNSSVTFQITGEIDFLKLEAGMKKIISDNESLRTFFYLENGGIYKGISAVTSFSSEVIYSKKMLDETIWEITRAFNFKTAPLARLFLVISGDGRRFLHLDMPHIISDGQSLNVIMQHLINFYVDRYTDEDRYQFSHFLKHQQQYLTGPAYKQDEIFWSEIAQEKSTQAPLDEVFPVQSEDDLAGGSGISKQLNGILYSEIKAYIYGKRLTRFQLLLAAFCLLICKLTGQSCIRVVVPVNNRQQPGFDDIIGLLVNAVFIKVEITKDDSTESFIENCQSVFLNALKHGRFPADFFYKLVNSYSGKKHTAVSNFFFSYNHITGVYCTPGFELRFVLPAKNREDQELSMALYDTGNGITAGLSSAKDLARKTELQKVLDTYESLVNLLMCSSSEQKIFELLNKI
jgi:amino acid adenylation domain-containing protein